MTYKFNPFTGTLDEVTPATPETPAFSSIATNVGTATAPAPNSPTFIGGGIATQTRAVTVDGITGVAIDNTDRGSVAVAEHEAKSDPHPQYQTEAEVNVQIRDGRDIYFWAGSGSPSRASEGSRIIQWHGAITTSTGTITFIPTANGDGTGSPLFDDLNACSYQVTCSRDTDQNNQSPWAHIRRTEDNRRVVVQVKRSNQGGILLGGTYFGNLNNFNNVTVFLTITGVAA